MAENITKIIKTAKWARAHQKIYFFKLEQLFSTLFGSVSNFSHFNSCKIRSLVFKIQKYSETSKKLALKDLLKIIFFLLNG